MKVFTSNDFKGYWPVGSAAVIVAENEEQARRMLNAVFMVQGPKQYPDHRYTLVEIDTTCYQVSILCDGNY